MYAYAVRLRNAYGKCHCVPVRKAPNADCAFWVAVYAVDPEDKTGFREVSVKCLSKQWSPACSRSPTWT